MSRLLWCLSSVALLSLVTGCGREAGGDIKATPSTTTATSSLPTSDELKSRLDAVIEMSRQRHLDPATNNAWQIIHGVLAYGYDLDLNVDGKTVAGLDWILNGGQFRGWVFAPGPKGLKAVLDPGTKIGMGHEDQWLGYMAQAHVDPSTKLLVNGQTYTLQDLIEQTKWDAPDRPEATWTIMGLAPYLPSTAKWIAKDGNEWSMDHIVKHEATEDLGISACGGSHLLYALAVALNRRKLEGQPITDGWLDTQNKIDAAIETAKRFQQPDGSFSTNFFDRASTARDIGVRINTTGHTLEFLAMALPAERLNEPWVTKATISLIKMLEATKDLDVECAGLYHAIHGLRLYRARVFGESESGHPVLENLAASR